MNGKYFLTVFLLVVINVNFASVQCKYVMPLKKEVWNELSCSEPQSRIAYLEDEYAEYNSDAIYLPHAAFVRFCDNSLGCCTKGHLYVSTKEEKITFAFQEFLRGNKTKKEIVLTNHSRCACRSIADVTNHDQ